MDCFWARCSNHKRCEAHGSCVAKAQAGGSCWPPAKVDRRERVAKVLDRSYPKVAAKIRAGMRSSTWPEDLVDPGLLLDLLEQKQS